MKFAKRMELFEDGVFSRQLALKNQKLAEGRTVIDMGIGAPNIPPAEHVVRALSKAAEDPKNYVYAVRDLSELLDAVVLWYRRRYGVMLDPAGQIVSLLGSQDGLAHIALSIVDKGEVVLVPDPCYPTFACGPRIAGAEIHLMPQREENGFIIDLRDIPSDIARRAKLMIISYPNNPTTAMAPDSFYRDLITFAREYDICVLHDNAYSDLSYDGRHCGSFLKFEGAADIGVEFNSLSKSYGLAGARIGFCIGNRDIVRNFAVLKSNMDYGVFLPVQKAAIAALTGDQACVADTCRAYEKRRNILCDGLTEIGWPVTRCPSTMFVWAGIPKNYTSSEKFCADLIERAGIIMTPGSAFGPSGEGYVRMALVRTEEEMRAAIRAIRESGILSK
ncbi:MAG: aminotransferase class I/II-fold pyridoxal phosphate-dependent enzyme [Oscillospiraceae bacterium]